MGVQGRRIHWGYKALHLYDANGVRASVPLEVVPDDEVTDREEDDAVRRRVITIAIEWAKHGILPIEAALE